LEIAFPRFEQVGDVTFPRFEVEQSGWRAELGFGISLVFSGMSEAPS